MAIDPQTVSPLNQPAWRILLLSAKGEEDITQRIDERLVSLTVTDKKGVESDELSLVLDDDDGQLALPPTGAQLAVSIGWQGQPLVSKGLFTIDELEYTGGPGQLSLRGRGAEVSQSLGVKKERSWHQITLGNLAATIAAEHALTLAVNAALKGELVSHEDQTNESDVNFLTRLAKKFDAICTVKAGKLLLTPAGQCKSVSGTPLTTRVIQVSDLQPGWRYHTADRTAYTGVRAYWHDPKASRRKGYLVGTKEHEKHLRDTYPNQKEAARAAKAEFQRIQRGEANFSGTLAQGDPGLGPESKVTLQGLKPEMNGDGWVAIEATHTISGSGYTTAFQLETR